MDFTPVFAGIISLLATIITAILVPVLKSWLAQKLGNELTTALLKWVAVGVKSAEQLYGHGNGGAKKAYVVHFIEDKLGVEVDDATLEAAIEAAVHELNASLTKE